MIVSFYLVVMMIMILIKRSYFKIKYLLFFIILNIFSVFLVLMKMELEFLVIWMIFLCMCYSFMISYNWGIVEVVEILKSVDDLDIE